MGSNLKYVETHNENIYAEGSTRITRSRRQHHRLLSFSFAPHLELAPAARTSLQPTAVPSESLVLMEIRIRHHRLPALVLSHRQRFCRLEPEESEGIVRKHRARQSHA